MSSILEEYEQLCQQKDEIEAEISAIADELTTGPNAPGLKGQLVDAEGFPRADIDVYRVRHQRHAFACKQTDHREIMQRIEKILPQMFEAKAPSIPTLQPLIKEPPPPRVGISLNEKTSEIASDALAQKQPFARIEGVQQDSPAAMADLQVHDQLLSFGSADATNHRQLEAIKDIVMRNVGSPIRVVVRRAMTSGTTTNEQEDQILELTLTPQTWRGPGVLGCVIHPLSTPTTP